MGFNPKQVLQELDDDVLPPKPAAPPKTTPPPAPSAAPAATAAPQTTSVGVLDEPTDDGHTDGTLLDEGEDEVPAGGQAAGSAPKEAPARRVRPGPKSASGARPTVDLPVSLSRRYKKVWQDGIAKGKKRTYAEILFDAIERQAPELAEHWKNAATEAQGKTTSLFPSRNAQPKRRSRDEPTKRFTLAGLTAADREVLEELERDWDAPSFVELVIVALDLDLPQARGARD